MVSNGLYVVHVTVRDPDVGMKGDVYLTIRDRNRTTRHDWRDFQRIKNEICGPEREAIELYPAESRLTDTANQYHLWVAPEGEHMPWGWEKPRTTLTNGEMPDDEQLAPEAERRGITLDDLKRRIGKARQRAFEDDGITPVLWDDEPVEIEQ